MEDVLSTEEKEHRHDARTSPASRRRLVERKKRMALIADDSQILISSNPASALLEVSTMLYPVPSQHFATTMHRS